MYSFSYLEPLIIREMQIKKARVGCFKRTALKHVYYLGWNRSPAQVGCMRQALGPGVLGRPRGSGCRGWWEGGSGWGSHVNPWLFHFNVWQNPLQIKIIIIIIIKQTNKKTQWDITSHWSEWPSSKSLQTVNAGEGVKKKECSCTIAGTVNWYSHYGRWYGDSLKN